MCICTTAFLSIHLLMDISSIWNLSQDLRQLFSGNREFLPSKKLILNIPLGRRNSVFQKSITHFKAFIGEIFYLFKIRIQFNFIYLTAACGKWDLSSLIRDWTCTLCNGSVQSLPLNHQGSSRIFIYINL